MKFTEEQKRIAKLLGIRNLDSQNDLNRIAAAQQTAKLLGIRNFDSANDAAAVNRATTTARLLGIRDLNSQKDVTQINQAQSTADRLGIKNINTARDIEQIRSAPPAPTSTPKPVVEETKPEVTEPFDYEGAMATAQQKFEVKNSGNEKDYAADFASLEDRLRDIQNRPNTDPLERARVMGVRFAGTSNKLKKSKKNPFAVKRDPKMGIRSQAINI